MGMQPFLGSATTQPDQRFNKFDFDDMADNPFKADLVGGWIAMLQHYFVSAWVPAPIRPIDFARAKPSPASILLATPGPACRSPLAIPLA